VQNEDKKYLESENSGVAFFLKQSTIK